MSVQIAPSRLAPPTCCAPARSACARGACAPPCRRVGIAIGIASMVAVLGISESSRADLIAQLDRLGTNLLRVAPGQSFFGDNAELPETARGDDPARRRRRGDRASTKVLGGVTVRRNQLIDANETGGIARDGGGAVAAGHGRRHARARALPHRRDGALPGRRARRRRRAAARHRPDRRARVARRPLVPGRRHPRAGHAVARARLRRRSSASTSPSRCSAPTASASTIYVRAQPDAIAGVRDLLGATANPERPEEVDVSRPSDALEARGGGQDRVHVAVPRPRRRRAAGGRRRDRQRDGDLGARAPLGGRAAARAGRHPPPRRRAVPVRVAAAGGDRAGWRAWRWARAVTAGYAASQGWQAVVPPVALAGGLIAATAIGAVAGLYPALRAARLSPTDALRSV